MIDTRKVIKEPGQKASKDVYYVPGYLRIKCKNFTGMDLENLNAGMNTTLIFTVLYGKLPKELVTELQSNIIFLFGRNDARALKSDDNLEVTVKNKPEDQEIQFTIRQILQLRIETDVFYTPFEIINLILCITVQPVVSKTHGTVKINLMDHPERFVKSSYAEQGTFGTYDLCERKMASQFSNDRVCTTERFYEPFEERKKKFVQKKVDKLNSEKDKIEQFQYGHFLIPIHKYPLVSLATIFLPLWLLAVINLSIFFQDTTLGDRIGSISAIMIAYIALIPTIRENIPPSPRIVFIQMLVYAESLTSLFVLIDSVSVRNFGENYDFMWSESGLFMISLIITIFTFVVITLMMVMHYCVWRPGYKMMLSDEKELSFKTQQWSNLCCDIYFEKISQLRSKKSNNIQYYVQEKKD